MNEYTVLVHKSQIINHLEFPKEPLSLLSVWFLAHTQTKFPHWTINFFILPRNHKVLQSTHWDTLL